MNSLNDNINWMNKEISNRERYISHLNKISLQQNICSIDGTNPLDTLRSEIKIIKQIKSVLIKDNK